jgi:hypothetical protein
LTTFTAALLTLFRAVGRTALHHSPRVSVLFFYDKGRRLVGAVGLTEGMLIALAVVSSSRQ